MEYKRKVWEHQRVAIEDRVIKERLNNFGLFFEVGTGKTGTAINIMRHWYKDVGQIMKTIIFSPPITLTNWKAEWEINSNVDPKKIIILTGHNKDRLALFNKHKDSNCIFITNYEALLMPDLQKAFVEWEPHVVVCDEGHKIKDHTSKRAKLLFPISDKAYYRLLLTGTPILNSYMDLYSQFRFLDRGETFGKNFFAFRGKYFYDKNVGMSRGSYFPDWRPRPNIAEELERLISQKSMVAKKKDCLTLPPLVKQTFKAGMTKEQSKAYTAMKKDLVAYIEGSDKAAVAQLALTKALRLQQIVSGFVKLDDGTIHRFKDSPREKDLKELLKDLCPQNKVLVWAVFHENYETIRKVCEELKLKYVEVTGEISEKQKREAVEQFKSDPDCCVFIGHPLSAGIGINLIEASVAVFYSRNFSLEQYLQAEGRNYRGGSEVHSSITHYDLVTEGTIDEDVLESLANKQAISDSVLLKALNK